MRIPVGILGVTGLVGRRILARLSDHPWFEVVEAGASERSVGASVSDLLAMARQERAEDGTAPRPGGAQGVERQVDPGLQVRALDGDWTAPLLISALPGSVAMEIERRLADAGHLVVSNASAWRADPGIPLVIPEINPDHLELIGSSGGIVTNPNCSVAAFAPALTPLHREFGIESAVVTTFQAVSGAGSSGPTVLGLMDNVFPIIGGEEEKLEREPGKLLGSVEGRGITSAPFTVSATTTRVPVLHGHLVDLSLRFTRQPSVAEATACMERWAGPLPLPSLPLRPLRVTADPNRPQPRLDRSAEGGMAITVGRVRACPVNHLRLMALAHNLERGAAGAAVANAELCRVMGKIPGVDPLPAPDHS